MEKGNTKIESGDGIKTENISPIQSKHKYGYWRWIICLCVILAMASTTFSLSAQNASRTVGSSQQSSRNATGVNPILTHESAQTEIVNDLLPDSVKYRYPLVNGLTLAVNIYEPVMKLFLNDYASYEASIALDLHHRFFPEFTFGIGHCDDESDEEVRYKVKATPYYKVGVSYNFKYNDAKSDKNYYSVVFRYGFSHSTADITNLTYTDGYWNEYGPVNLYDQSFNTHWVELGFGIKVNIHKNLSMGWDFKWKPIIHSGATQNANPYFVPGYGSTAVKFGLGYYIFYDIF